MVILGSLFLKGWLWQLTDRDFVNLTNKNVILR